MKPSNLIRALFTVPADNPALTRSQLAAFSKQVPLLYFILVTNTIAVACTHFGSTPVLLTVYIPGCLCCVCIARLVVWRRMSHQNMSDADAVNRLRTTVRLVVVLGISFALWGFSIYPYGDAYAQSQVPFYMAITVIGCIFCLMHLRPAALLLTLIVIIPFTIFFSLTGKTVFIAISINVALVCIAMIFILFTNYRDFATLIESRKELLARQAETQRLSDENMRLANIDSLTDLPNRRRFLTDIGTLLEAAHRHKTRCALGLIDLDGFKPVNDIYGHAIGDRVLVEVGRRLARITDSTMFVARLGGDEFGVIITGDHSDAALLDIGKTICAALRAPYVMPEVTAQFSGSIGFATFPEAGQTVGQLFERADYALYYAKQNHRGAPVIFSHEHETEIRNLSLIEQGLRHADIAQELSIAYQPIIDVATNTTIGFEALARWTSTMLGPVPPAVFIKVAERSDLINGLTELLLEKTLRDVRSWPVGLHVSFNLSTRDVSSPEAIARITKIVQDSGVAPHRIGLEITETAVMRDFEDARASLLALKHIGAHISLDDFGTGYSSLSYVHRLPLDKIKIDRSFIAEIETDTASRNVVKTVIDLCSNLNLGCVIEGIESVMQVHILRDLGCPTMQGYFFGRPMPASEIATYLETEHLSMVEPFQDSVPRLAI